MAFLETPRFPGSPSYGFISQPDYSVTIVRRAGGHEKRNRNWSRPLYRYTVTVGPRVEDSIQELLEFWHAVGGQADGFRFKDYADYKSCRVNETATATDQGVETLAQSPTAYQLIKTYTSGANSQQREIYKPVSGTILIADNGVAKTENTHWTMDYTTGELTMLYVPAGTITWGGEFDVPVRFDSEFPIEIQSHEVQGVSFALMELRL